MSVIRSRMRRALGRGASVRGEGVRQTLSAPVAGLNTADAEAAMNALYAIEMENFFPADGRVTTRRGSEVFRDIDMVTDPVETLFNWRSGTNDIMFGITDSKIYDLTSADDPSEVVTSGITDARWSFVNFGGHGILTNGEDAPLRIDNTGSWVAHGFIAAAGETLDVSDLYGHTVYNRRLFFLEKGTTKLWYGGAAEVMGELTSYDVGLIDGSFGDPVAAGVVSTRTGAGLDNLLAVFFERGDGMLFSGDDPGDADSWALVNTFHIAPPVGDRPLLRYGTDLVIITANGFMRALDVVREQIGSRVLALSDKVAPSVTSFVADGREFDGWQGVYFPEERWLLFNIPTTTSPRAYVQMVMNTQSQAWTVFSGMNAHCWGLWDGRLFFGGNGKVFEANVGTADDGEAIRSLARGAFTRLGSVGDKHFRLMRAHLESTGAGTAINVGVSTDFDRSPLAFSTGLTTSAGGSKWNAGKWNTFKWASGVSRHRAWKHISSRGAYIAPHVSISSTGERVTWFSTDFMYNPIEGALTGLN